MLRTLERLGGGTINVVAGFGDFCRFSGRTINYSVTTFGRWRMVRLLLEQMYQVGTKSIPVVMITGAFVGMVLAEFSSGDTFWIRRLRTLTVGFLRPFYFICAGTFVSMPALVSAPLVFLLLLGGKVVSKIFGLYPIIGQFRRRRDERRYYTLMMSTGLTFGTISSLYGFLHNIVTQDQYSFLVTVVITSAVVPTLIAGIAFLPRHLFPKTKQLAETMPRENGLSDEG